MNLRIRGVPLNLESAASSIFAALGAHGWEQRQSSNYAEDRYLHSLVEGFHVCLALSDDVVEGYPLLLWVTTPSGVPQTEREKFERIIEARLRAAGVELSQ